MNTRANMSMEAQEEMASELERLRNVTKEMGECLVRMGQQNAAMRGATERFCREYESLLRRGDFDDDDSLQARRTLSAGRAALQPDAGQRYLSPEDVRPLVESLRMIAGQHRLEGALTAQQMEERADYALRHTKSLGL